MRLVVVGDIAHAEIVAAGAKVGQCKGLRAFSIEGAFATGGSIETGDVCELLVR
jgi:hypothetical protein